MDRQQVSGGWDTVGALEGGGAHLDLPSPLFCLWAISGCQANSHCPFLLFTLEP